MFCLFFIGSLIFLKLSLKINLHLKDGSLMVTLPSGWVCDLHQLGHHQTSGSASGVVSLPLSLWQCDGWDAHALCRSGIISQSDLSNGFVPRPSRGGHKFSMHPSTHTLRTRGRSLTTGDTSSSSTWSTSSSLPSSWSTSSSALWLWLFNGRGRHLTQTVVWTR